MAYIGQKPTDKPLSASDLEDGLITNSKLAQDIISGETELAVAPADTDEFLISDAGVLKRLDASLVGSQDFVKIASTTVSSNVSSVTLTGFDDTVYGSYYLRINNAKTDITGTNRGRIMLRVNTSGGVQSGGSDYTYFNYHYYRRWDTDSNVERTTVQEGDDKIKLHDWSLSADDAQNSDIWFANPTSTSQVKIFNITTTVWKHTSTGADGPYTFSPQDTSGIYQSTTALTGLTFLPTADSASNISAGSFCLYGLKK